MGAWSLKIAIAASQEWFLRRLAAARAVVPAADFDTIIRVEADETVTIDLVDIVGTADASPAEGFNGGVVTVTCGDPVVEPNSCMLEKTGSGSHVGSLLGKSWYMASLVRLNLSGLDLTDRTADAIALHADATNHVGLGLMAAGSGGSDSLWTGYINNDSNVTTVQGPSIGGETDVWHLAEAWSNGVSVYFRIDGVAFDDTLDAADLPDLSAAMGMILSSPNADANPQLSVDYDKACIIVASPRVGEAN